VDAALVGSSFFVLFVFIDSASASLLVRHIV
jgi:hypothetical protein